MEGAATSKIISFSSNFYNVRKVYQRCFFPKYTGLGLNQHYRLQFIWRPCYLRNTNSKFDIYHRFSYFSNFSIPVLPQRDIWSWRALPGLWGHLVEEVGMLNFLECWIDSLSVVSQRKANSVDAPGTGAASSVILISITDEAAPVPGASTELAFRWETTERESIQHSKKFNPSSANMVCNRREWKIIMSVYPRKPLQIGVCCELASVILVQLRGMMDSFNNWFLWLGPSFVIYYNY